MDASIHCDADLSLPVPVHADQLPLCMIIQEHQSDDTTLQTDSVSFKTRHLCQLED